jgi:hypothetical protein
MVEIIEKKFKIDQVYKYETIEEEELPKYIKKVESKIRKSFEYRRYINYIKFELDIMNDVFLSKINDPKMIEIHHFPLALFDIVKIILNKNTIEKINIHQFDIADEVMKCHYRNIIGLVPLTVSNHKLVESEYSDLKISLNQVFGDFITFLNEYKTGVSKDIKNKLESILEHESSISSNYNPIVLKVAITKILPND